MGEICLREVLSEKCVHKQSCNSHASVRINLEVDRRHRRVGRVSITNANGVRVKLNGDQGTMDETHFELDPSSFYSSLGYYSNSTETQTALLASTDGLAPQELFTTVLKKFEALLDKSKLVGSFLKGCLLAFTLKVIVPRQPFFALSFWESSDA